MDKVDSNPYFLLTVPSVLQKRDNIQSKVKLFCFELLILGDCVMWESVGACVGWKEARFEALETNADALSSSRSLRQYCGHFRCEEWTLDDCCAQRGKKLFCSDVTA